MANRKRVRADRIIILVLASLLILGVIIFGITKLVGLFFSSDDKDVPTKQPVVTETIDDLSISLKDYVIYTDDTGDLGFDFAIATFNFKANEPISFELKNFQTSEKINLNNIDKYINKLELAGYSLSKLDINTSGISSTENNVDAKLFVPFTTNSDNLSIYNLLNKKKFDIDISSNKIPATALKLENNNTQIEVGTTKVSVTNAYISDNMLHQDQPYELASSMKVYTFEITVTEAQDNVTITDATFIEKGNNYENKCLNSEFKSIDMENILDKNLKAGTKGGLFFEIYSNENTVGDGTLLIKFSNSDKVVEISTKGY